MASSDLTAASLPRDRNGLRMLEQLMWQRTLSRAELSHTLGLSRATVTALLADLERAGLLDQRTSAPDPERRPTGRPPLQVSLRPSAAYAIGLDFEYQHVRAAVCDLGGNIVASRTETIDVESDARGALELAAALTRAALADADIPSGLLVGAGVGFTAPVDPTHRTVVVDDLLPSWKGIDIAAELERRLRMPVEMENDANAGALAEHLFGAGRDVADMIYVRLSEGIGVGLVVAGELYRGTSGVAGELGHSRVVSDGLICRCGNRGCLETIAGAEALTDVYRRSLGRVLTPAEFVTAACEGDRGARRLIADAGHALGRALAGAVNLLNPRLIVIGGELARTGELVLEPVRAAIADQAATMTADAVRVVPSLLGNSAEVIGAATTQLAHAPAVLERRLYAGT